MLQAGILAAEMLLTWQANLSSDLQHFTLGLTGSDRRSEKYDPINQLVLSNSGTYMIIPTIFFKFLLWQTSIKPYFYLKGARREGLWVNCTELIILETI